MNTQQDLGLSGLEELAELAGDVAAGALYGPHPNPDPRVRAG